MPLNERLQKSVERLTAHYTSDARCLAVFLWGSAGRGNADLFSDIDFGVVVADADYAAMRAELRAVCERECGTLTLWLAEADNDGFCSIAFLFLDGDEVLLYDFMMISSSLLSRYRPKQVEVLLDRENLFLEPVAESKSKPTSDIQTIITTYWVYCYLNGKYFQRGDIYKILYVQQVLFQTHFRLLGHLFPSPDWGWWAMDIKHLSEPHRKEMLAYWGAATQEQVAKALTQEVDTFSRDARQACLLLGETYPAQMEADVRRHLKQNEVLS